jgi:redox-sensitive bicupin YhaK (pirin superfamily)
MITLRRNTERRHLRRGKCDIWLTFAPGSLAGDFGALAAFSEILFRPGGRASPHPGEDAEIITYVYRGALAHEDSTGSSGVIHAGEFQRMTTGREIRHRESNPSRTDWAHVFRISLRRMETGHGCAHEQRRFPAAQRHNLLCVVASPDGRKSSLRMLQDAVIYSSILDPGHHPIHELLPGRSAWLHVIHGRASLQDIILTRGDGVGVTIEPSVSLTAQEDTEILLVDLGSPVPVAPSR